MLMVLTTLISNYADIVSVLGEGKSLFILNMLLLVMCLLLLFERIYLFAF